MRINFVCFSAILAVQSTLFTVCEGNQERPFGLSHPLAAPVIHRGGGKIDDVTKKAANFAADLKKKKEALEDLQSKTAADLKKKKKALEDLQSKTAADLKEKKEAVEDLKRKAATEYKKTKEAVEDLKRKAAIDFKKTKQSVEDLKSEAKKIAKTERRKDAIVDLKHKKDAVEDAFDDEDFSIAAFLAGRMKTSTAFKGLVDRLKTSDRFPYLISLALSAVYFYYFNFTPPPTCKNYVDGFCVTGITGVEKQRRCPEGNSHIWSWYEDIVFTIISIILPFASKTEFPLGSRISTPAIIFGHGFLHKWISSKGCSIVDPALVEMGEKFYSAFVVALTSIMFFGFSNLPGKRPALFILLEVLGISYGIISQSLAKVADGNAIAMLFLSTQLIVSYLGAFHPGAQSTKIVGQTFIFPCIVSLLECLKCDWFNTIGKCAYTLRQINFIVTLFTAEINFCTRVLL